ncbi:hypothetical protein G9A89_003542 [Geosiphon pyriformis]|nr:hypothetical protein G9A89_003542 [Geosiphon pyriformis]
MINAYYQIRDCAIYSTTDDSQIFSQGKHKQTFMASQQLLQALCYDFGSILNNQIASVRIVVGDGPNTKTFHAHLLILATRSSYFATSLSSNYIEKENTIIFSIPNISPEILRYIYNGEIELDEYGVPIILELLVAAEELILEDLISHLEDYLIKQHEEELKENFLTSHETSYKHPSFKKLQAFFTEIAAINPAVIFNSQDFTSLDQNVLTSILARDDLNMKESEIWEKIMEWGVDTLGNNIQIEDVLNWTDENIDGFKESIGELLSLIPVLSYIFLPGSHQNLEDAQPLRVPSALLRINHVRQLDHWIQRRAKNTPFESQLGYDFNLLLRGSQDGLTPADFHQLCDNKGATVTIIKVKGTGQLIGGYNPEFWHSRDSWIDGKGSFLFSFGDGKVENAELSKFVGDVDLTDINLIEENAGRKVFLNTIHSRSQKIVQKELDCNCVRMWDSIIHAQTSDSRESSSGSSPTENTFFGMNNAELMSSDTTAQCFTSFILDRWKV